MTKKRKTGLAIEAAAACIAVQCAAGACSGAEKEEKAVRRVIATSVTSTPLTTSAPMTTTATTTAVTTTEPQITTGSACSTTEKGVCETPTPTTTTTSVTTTAPAPTEPYHGQTSGDYIYVNGFGWVFNEGGGGYGETNYDMYCNGNKIGYFG